MTRETWEQKGGAGRRGPRKSSQFDGKLGLILQTGARMFTERGYENTSLDNIAEKLKIHKTTIYHYIKQKEDILYQALMITIEGLGGALEEAETGVEPPLERLKRFFLALVEVQTTDFGRCLCQIGPQPLSKEPGKKIKKEMRRMDKAVRDLVTQGIAEGSIRPCDPKLVSAMLFGAFNSLVRWYRKGGAYAPSDVGNAYLDFFVNGIATRGAPRSGTVLEASEKKALVL